MEGLDGENYKKETILARHKLDLKRRSQVAKQVRLYKSQKKQRRDKNAIITLNRIFKKSKQRALDTKRLNAQEKRQTEYIVPEYRLLLVIRNHRTVETEESKRHLRALCLEKRGSARFLTNSKENLSLLDKISPFVYYGTPSLKNVRLLMEKRATILVSSGEPLLISSNLVLEEHFRTLGILCLSDVIDAIFFANDTNDQQETILSKLGPIELSSNLCSANIFQFGDIGDDVNSQLAL